MSDENEELTRSVILLRRDGDLWRAELPDLKPGWSQTADTIAHAVAAARTASDKSGRADLNLKVAEETELARDDVLALIEGAWGRVDLSRCSMWGIDLSPEALQLSRDAYSQTRRRDPLRTSHSARGVILLHVDLQHADLRKALLQRAAFVNVQLRGANLWAARLQGADLTDVGLQGANLSWALLQGAHLIGCDLRAANLKSAQLQEVDLYTVDSLAGTSWYGAFLDRTRMRREQLGDAIGDELKARRIKDSEHYRQASEAYRILKTNFKSIGRHDDEKWALSKQQSMEQAALWRERNPIGALFFLARRHRNVAIGAFTFSATLLGVIVTLLTLFS